MLLAVGNRFGPYEVTAKLGAGGMGEVWRATDTRLRRDVAIKVLPAAFVADKARLARFKREAQLLAQLHHPNIASIFGLEESDGMRALVMELVEGEDLSARIARGPLPLDEALPIARQIAEALEAAHEKGIVHRDLKPANVKLTTDGKVKVLDFGLAKAIATPEPPLTQAHGLPAALMDSPTQTPAPGTELGMIVGTTAYMAPEQARGLPADKRADIWSFGVVLWEALAGRRLFTGASTNDVLAAVLTREVDWALLPASTPPALRTLLRRCLERNLKSRLRDIADARFAIEDLLAGRSEVGRPSPGPPPRLGVLRRAARLAGVALLAALVGGLVTYFSVPRASTAPRRTTRFLVSPPERNVFTPPDRGGGVALSPDGLQLVFVATDDQQVTRLWLRALDAVEARPLAGTEGASYPFWSPDSRWIAFFAGDLLRKVGLAGAPPQTICAATTSPRGGSWGADGTIVFAPDYTQSLQRVSANGGSPAPLTTLDAQGLESSHRFPSFLPDGRRFVYLVKGDRERGGVYLGSLAGAAPRLLVRTSYNAVFAPPRHLLYARDRALVAQPLDEKQMLPVGEPILIEPQVSQAAEVRGNAWFSSAAGAVAYQRGERTAEQVQLRWYDRGGRELGVVGPETAGYRDPAPSPDGKRLAVNRMVAELGVYQIFIVDADSGSATRFTFETSDDWLPVWSPDGSRLAFGCNQMGQGDRICVRAGSGAGGVEVLLAPAAGARPTDWSVDGSLLLFELGLRTARRDLWALPLDRSKKPFAVVATTADEAQGQLSPDGSWLAYASNESGRYEIYVQPLAGGGKWQVSTEGGTQPRWRRDGRELFFLGADQKVMAVPCRAASEAFHAGPPRALFQAHIGGGLAVGTDEFVPSPDGRRFLVATLVEQPGTATPIVVVLDWAAELTAH